MNNSMFWCDVTEVARETGPIFLPFLFLINKQLIHSHKHPAAHLHIQTMNRSVCFIYSSLKLLVLLLVKVRTVAVPRLAGRETLYHHWGRWNGMLGTEVVVCRRTTKPGKWVTQKQLAKLSKLKTLNWVQRRYLTSWTEEGNKTKNQISPQQRYEKRKKAWRLQNKKDNYKGWEKQKQENETTHKTGARGKTHSPLEPIQSPVSKKHGP